MTDVKTTKPTTTSDDDQVLEEHGVKDIIPENEEYYTLDMKRTFDDRDEDEELETDIVGGNPLAEDADDTGEIVTDTKDYRPQSSNQGGPVDEEDIVDQDSGDGVQVGEPGANGIDDGTG